LSDGTDLTTTGALASGVRVTDYSLDVTRVIDSPAEQIRTGYTAGATGVLVRGQLQKMF